MPEAARSLTANPVCRSSGKSPDLTASLALRIVGGTDFDPPSLPQPVAPATGAADATAEQGGATPTWAAFERWCAAQHAQHRFGNDDASSDRLGAVFAEAEAVLRETRPVTVRDFAAKAYAALHVLDCFPEPDAPVLLGSECHAFTQALVADILGSFPEIRAMVLGLAA